MCLFVFLFLCVLSAFIWRNKDIYIITCSNTFFIVEATKYLLWMPRSGGKVHSMRVSVIAAKILRQDALPVVMATSAKDIHWNSSLLSYQQTPDSWLKGRHSLLRLLSVPNLRHLKKETAQTFQNSYFHPTSLSKLQDGQIRHSNVHFPRSICMLPHLNQWQYHEAITE